MATSNLELKIARRAFWAWLTIGVACGATMGQSASSVEDSKEHAYVTSRQITTAAHGHILTNCNVWSPDSEWIVYDIRSDPAGSVFDGTRIERVRVKTGEVQILYESTDGACCGVATCSPVNGDVVFIHGPERPTPDWRYSAAHRRGLIVDSRAPGRGRTLDARDLTPPYTPGALRGGTHVHVYSADARWVSFTYEDHVLSELATAGGNYPAANHDLNQRNVGVSIRGRRVTTPRTHPRNHDGESFSVLVTQTTNSPRPGSDEIQRADHDAWVGTGGYRTSNGSWQGRALAFIGDTISSAGQVVPELFIVDIPDDVTRATPGTNLAGTPTTRPAPPLGTRQRRLTYTSDKPYPGVGGVRHWPRSSPDGASSVFVMRDARGIAQLWSISPRGGEPRQLSDLPFDVASAFTWSPDGRQIAFVADRSVFVLVAESRSCVRLTAQRTQDLAPRPEACVFSPDGAHIAYVCPVAEGGTIYNQVFVIEANFRGG
jgi:hypothetical protein